MSTALCHTSTIKALPTTASPRALVLVGESVLPKVRGALQQTGWRLDVCSDASHLPHASGWQLIVVADDGNGLVESMLTKFQSLLVNKQAFLIVLTATPTSDQSISYLHRGAFEYLPFSFEVQQFLRLTEQIRRQVAQAPEPCNEAATYEAAPESLALIGQSPAMLALSREIVQVAHMPGMRSFIEGETGTGKEIVARQIHALSECTGAFHPINCAATVESLLESELFGHERGSFTGANTTKKGLWEEAAEGTIFLDEITEAPPSVQAKLLRVLQEGTIRRVGANREIKVNVRVIAASNRNVEKAIKKGAFRADLRYRLGTILHMPPLRQRLEDIPLLTEHFLRRHHCATRLTPEAIQTLCSWHWPGNVRELEMVVQKLVSLNVNQILREHVLGLLEIESLLPPWIELGLLSGLRRLHPEHRPKFNELRDHYVAALALEEPRITAIARIVGLDTRTVGRILSERATNDAKTNMANLVFDQSEVT